MTYTSVCALLFFGCIFVSVIFLEFSSQIPCDYYVITMRLVCDSSIFENTSTYLQANFIKLFAQFLANMYYFLYLCGLFYLNSMLKGILIAVGAVAISLLLLCVRIIIQKNGKFSSEHISENKRMRQDGIHCANSQDRETRRKANKKLNVSEL